MKLAKGYWGLVPVVFFSFCFTLNAGQFYSIQDLGHAGTTGFGSAEVPLQSAALNNRGGVAYTLLDADKNLRGFYDQGSGPVDTGTLHGKYAVVRAINDSGTITGYSDSLSLSNPNQAFVYEGGIMSSIHTLGFNATTEAWDINSGGIVVGEFRGGFGFPGSGGAFIYDPQIGSMQDLQTVLPVSSGDGEWLLRRANAVNDSGEIVGYGMLREAGMPPLPSPFVLPGDSSSGSVQRGFYYNGQTLINIGTLKGGYVSMAVDINEIGVVAGHSGLADGSLHAVKYENGMLVDLGTLREKSLDGDSFALAINNFNQIVGAVIFPEVSRAFIYEDGKGMRDLNDLIKPGSGWDHLSAAWDINDAGEIIGLGHRDGELRIFHMSPSGINQVPCEKSDRACEALESVLEN